MRQFPPSSTLLFLFFIMGICEVSGVQFDDSDERINNKNATTMRKVERIVGEPTTATTPKHHIVARAEKCFKNLVKQ